MADTKPSAFTTATSYAASDVMPFIADPGGAPLNRIVTFANLLGKMPTAPLPSAAAGSDIGSATLPWKDLWLAGSSGTPGTNNFRFTGTPTGARVITFPDASGTVTLGGNSFTGTGDVVRATSPALVTPTLGVATVTSVNKITVTAPATGATLTLTDGKTLSVSNTLTLAGTDGATITFQGTDTYVGRDTTDTLSNKTLASPAITGSITFPDNVRQTFNPGADAAGLNVGSITGDPGTPTNGDLWYDSTGNLLRARINGATVSLGAAGANTVLSNLAAVSINASLIPQTTLDLGAAATAWRDLYLYGSGVFGSDSLKLTGAPTDNRTVTFPDNTGTVAELNLAQTFTVTQTIDPADNTEAFIITGYSLTGSNAQSAIDIAGTWNTTGTPSAIKLNITDTASNASSVLLNLQVGSASKFAVFKSGNTGILHGAPDAPLDIRHSDNTSGNVGLKLAVTNNSTRWGFRVVNSSGSFALDKYQGSWTEAYLFSVSTGGFGINTSGIGLTAMLHVFSSATTLVGTKINVPSGSTADIAQFQTNGANQFVVRNDGFWTDLGTKRVSTQFDKTDVTLANVTGLSVNVAAGRTYSFEANLFVNADVTGGSKYAVGGTATATAITYEIELLDDTTNAHTIADRQTALGGASGQAGTTAGRCRIRGCITVNAAGTLTIQFAQNAANATSSVLVGSDFIVRDNP